jgi:hypothetical protein
MSRPWKRHPVIKAGDLMARVADLTALALDARARLADLVLIEHWIVPCTPQLRDVICKGLWRAVYAKYDSVPRAAECLTLNLSWEIGPPSCFTVDVFGLASIAEQPATIGEEGKLLLFRDRLFLVQQPPATEAARERLRLSVKKLAYEEEQELLRLRAAVANYEALGRFTSDAQRRQTIPADVRRVVWTRDGGACVRCGARQNLHYDHIIPFAKGGANCAENLQVLCQPCNLRKSDSIAN